MRTGTLPPNIRAGALLAILTAACGQPRLESADAGLHSGDSAKAPDADRVSEGSEQPDAAPCDALADAQACNAAKVSGLYAVRSFLFDRMDYEYFSPTDFFTLTTKQLLFAEVHESATGALIMTTQICSWSKYARLHIFVDRKAETDAAALPRSEYELTVQDGKWRARRTKPTLFGYRERYPGCSQPGTRVSVPPDWSWNPGSTTCACVDPLHPPSNGQLDDCRLDDVDHDNRAGFTTMIEVPQDPFNLLGPLLVAQETAFADEGDFIEGELNTANALQRAERENHGTWSFLRCDDVVGCPQQRGCATSANRADFVRIPTFAPGQECEQIVAHEADLFEMAAEPTFPRCE